ncbi:MAG: aldehyde dehydrogenase family protein [Aphanocapsa sp. GSE-SYN-MK-11-07L]|jgi:acyl-CoA reductase-like NAD-dependent aldehyde dehydrogenase|nr:aldehyde dehydrogenase family protein [Aphanocapsa sp. GSE-SYN-MK-11-07L]
MGVCKVVQTDRWQADQIVHDLANRKQRWLEVEIPERINYLRRCVVGVQAVAATWVEVACQIKGIDPNSNLAGEEWTSGPLTTLANLQQLIQALAANGQPQPIDWRTAANGQKIARVFPRTVPEKLLWRGFRAEVWLQPDLPATQGAIYRQQTQMGRVALVLGAGNNTAIAPTDSLYKLFAENQVVLLKMNPVNAAIGPILAQAFQPLISAGWWQIVYGGADLGAYLCQHPEIDTVHITGSHHSHDAIVWGSDPIQQAERKAAGQPPFTKPITSELGCVTPILVVPGPWSASDLAWQARHVASMVAHNASFNCVAGKVLITATGWPQRRQFLAQVEQALARIPPRYAYYPGAQERYQQFLDRYPQAQPLSARTETMIPWTLIADLPAQAGEYALVQEAFCGVLAEVALAANDAANFLEQAVNFANQTIWGNLSCVVLIHPATQKRVRVELERAIAALRYGNIGINVWTGVGFLLTTTTWGAFPGNPLAEISSGQGVVHNTYLFDHPEKSVLSAPFRIFPLPAWFAGHCTLGQLGPILVDYEAAPTWGKLLRIVSLALRG